MNNKSRTEFAFLNITTNFFGFFLNVILGFIARIFFVRYLTADYLGLHALFTNIVTMLSITELGIGGVIAYTFYNPLAKNDYKKILSLYHFFSKIYSIIGIVVLIIGVTIIPFLKTIVKDTNNIHNNIYYIYILFLIGSSATYFISHKIALLRASQRDYLVIGSSYIISIIQNITQIIALIYTKNYLIYLYLQVFFGFAYILLISYISNNNFNYLKKYDKISLSKKEKKNIFKNIWALSITKISGLLVNNTDNIIISLIINISTVGLLSNYLLLTKTIQSLFGNLLISIGSGVGNYFETEGKENTQKLFHNILFIAFLLYAWVSISIIVLANDIIKLLFGDAFIMSQKVVTIITLNFYMVGIQSVLWLFRNALGLFNYKKYLLLITALINLVFSLLLGKVYGVIGVLLATTIARLFTNWWYDPVVVYKYGFDTRYINYFKKYFFYLAITIIISFMSFYICKQIDFHLAINILLKLFISSSLFLSTIFIFFRKKTEFIFVLNKYNSFKNK